MELLKTCLELTSDLIETIIIYLIYKDIQELKNK